MPDFFLPDFLPDMDITLVAAWLTAALLIGLYYVRRAAERSRRAREAAQDRLRTTGC